MYRPLSISRVYCVIDNCNQAEQRAKLYLVRSGASGKALEENFDPQSGDVMKTLVMITRKEAEDLSAIFAHVEEQAAGRLLFESEK